MHPPQEMATENLYTVELDKDTAFLAAQNCASVLLLDVPQGTYVGIDHGIFSAGPRFCGIKMIPPGTHFISTMSTDNQGGFSPVVGFFVHLQLGDVLVRKWNCGTEVLDELDNEEDALGYIAGVKRFDFDSGMAPYNLKDWHKWGKLSGSIGKNVVERVSPVGGLICVLGEGDDMWLKEPRTEAERKLVEQLEGQGGAESEVGGNKVDFGKCFYTEIPGLVKKSGLVAAELTALNLDKSAVLVELLSLKFNGRESDLLGEFQFAFLAFVLAQSLLGFHQWKAYIGLMLGCDDAALSSHSGLFIKFIRALHEQLVFALGQGNVAGDNALFGVDLLEDMVEDSFLKPKLMWFLKMVDDAAGTDERGVEMGLAKECDILSKFLKSKFGWDIAGDEEDDEYAPVVVDL